MTIDRRDSILVSAAALARELGLSRQAIYDARNRFPDAPKKHEDGKRENLAAWQEFVGAKLIGKDHATKNLSDLKAELMREQIRLARSKNEREAGDVIDREVVEAMLVTLGQKLNLLLRLKLEVELGPRGVGMNAAELNVEGGVVTDFAHEVKACALGQASSGIMARHVVGATASELRQARLEMLAMLKENGEGPSGRFEDMRFLKPVRDYKARHASTMLTFDAVVDCLDQIEHQIVAAEAS